MTSLTPTNPSAAAGVKDGFTYDTDREVVRQWEGTASEAGPPQPLVPSAGLSRSELDKVVGILQWIRGVLEGSRRTHRLALDAMPTPEAWSDALPPSAKEIVGVHMYNDLSDEDFDALRVADAERYTGARGVSWFRGGRSGGGGGSHGQTTVRGGGGGGGGATRGSGGCSGGGGGSGAGVSPGSGGEMRGDSLKGGDSLGGGEAAAAAAGTEQRRPQRGGVSGVGGGAGAGVAVGVSHVSSSAVAAVAAEETAPSLPMTDVDAWQLLDALEKAEAVWSLKRRDQEVLDQLHPVDLSVAASTLTFGLIGGTGGAAASSTLHSGGAGRVTGRAGDLARRISNAAALRRALYARYPSVGLTSLESMKVRHNQVTALAVLEAGYPLRLACLFRLKT